MNYVYKHPHDMEPIERERYFIKHFSNAILENEEHKKDKDDYWVHLVGESFCDEQIAFCKRRISEARARLAPWSRHKEIVLPSLKQLTRN